MLNFFRKHQKYFFFVITAAVIVSFCFFGTYSTMGQQEIAADRPIGQGVNGKPLMQREVAALATLIASSPYDGWAKDKGGMPNFLNDGVVEKDFLSNGLGVILAKRYFSELKPDLDQRVKKIHSYRPYVHPYSSQISAEGAWSRFSPQLLEHYRLLKGRSDQATAETLAFMCRLYVDQAMVPAEVLKQMLALQQNQLGVAPDPHLANANLHLFGFQSMEEWFGPKFVSLVAQFITNAAQIAEERGYQVKTEEIRASLFQNICSGYEHFARNAKLPAEEAERYYQMKMRSLGFDENTLLSSWKKVILFRRLFEEGSASVLIDPLAYQQFDGFARENVHVSLYQLPTALQFPDFRSMLKFQVYLEGISADSSRLRTDLRLPTQIASLEQIEKKAPELVERQVEIEWSSVSKEELSRSISIKETWGWETSDSNWELLKKNFTPLTPSKAQTKEERLSALSALDEKVRSDIDQFARLKMIDEQPMQMKLSLEMASVEQASISLKQKGTVFGIAGLKESSELIQLLAQASLKAEAPNAASEKLLSYSAGGDRLYQIQVVSRGTEKKVLAFAQASSDGTLDLLLDKKLEESYPDVRKRDPKAFQQINGQMKPFKEVRDQVAKAVFADLLKSIEENYRSAYGFLPGKEGDLPFHFYSNARLLTFMKEAHLALSLSPEDSSWLKQEGEELAKQWLLEKQEKWIERCTQTPFSKEEMFTLNSQDWSSVKVGERGAIAFYCVQERGPAKNKPVVSVEQGHQILSFDAKRDMMLQVLEKIGQKKAIDLSYLVAEEM
jgi:GcvH upstream region-like protein